MEVSWAARTDPGLRRSQNEDRFCARPEIGLFVVADGMGGHAGGEVASELAVAEIQDLVDETSGLGPDDTGPLPLDPTLGRDGRRLRAGFERANRRIAAHVSGDHDLQGMATTAVALLVTEALATVAHVGDSRAYLYRDRHLTRLTHDHSWVEEQLRAGMLTEAAARDHPWRNIVTRALSGTDDIEVDVVEVELRAADCLLLCSDGLSSVLSDGEIADVMSTTADLEVKCDALVARANDAGGPDNVTTLLVIVG